MVTHPIITLIYLLTIAVNVGATTPAPSFKPSRAPTLSPTQKPTVAPTSKAPVPAPSAAPTASTFAPSFKATAPTRQPTRLPTAPTRKPTLQPTAPSKLPTLIPSLAPSPYPTNPTMAPSELPTRSSPTPNPTNPTADPTAFPSQTKAPTPVPSFRGTPSPTSLVPGSVLVEFPFTGFVQVFTVPAEVSELTVTLVGASGGDQFWFGAGMRGGGRGALITAKVPVNPGDELHIHVGGMGGNFVGGYNGGGNAVSKSGQCAAGGGATDLRTYPFGIDDRMLVAGGGGGSSGMCAYEYSGGHGGYPDGWKSAQCTSYNPAKGGAQQSGGDFSDYVTAGKFASAANRGSFFQGGDGFTQTSGEGFGGGGGGGYYGGGGSYGSGGGGGSSYSNYPIIEALNGTWVGNGTAWITYVLAGNENPTMKPTLTPTLNPTVIATSAPSLPPSAPPTLSPSALPSELPSLMPSVAPSLQSTVMPTFTVTAPIPTAPPSEHPSANPSITPTTMPSLEPSIRPSESPTLNPSAMPSLTPTVVPTYTVTAPIPTMPPSQHPSADPSALPTMLPSEMPSVMPSAWPSTAGPSLAPSNAPSNNPTVMPSAAPTEPSPTAPPSENLSAAPSQGPTAVPTARPTVDPYVVELGVEQVVYGINNCTTQPVACNLTIQHTVADVIPGVVPERVTDIVVEEEEEEGGGRVRNHILANSNSFLRLKYKVAVYDPLLSADSLTRQMITKVNSKEMDAAFNKNARRFGLLNLQNASFAEPLVVHLNQAGGFNDPPTAGEIAGIVVGGFVFLVLLTVGVWLLTRYLHRREANEKALNSAATTVAAAV